MTTDRAFPPMLSSGFSSVSIPIAPLRVLARIPASDCRFRGRSSRRMAARISATNRLDADENTLGARFVVFLPAARRNEPGDRPRTVHIAGVAVVLGEKGVLIRGASGTGKSSLALALVEAWSLRGDFARLVGDDRICARVCGGRALVSPHPAIAGLAEWRGLGLIAQKFEGLRRARPDRRSRIAGRRRRRARACRNAEDLRGEFLGSAGVGAAAPAGSEDRQGRWRRLWHFCTKLRPK